MTASQTITEIRRRSGLGLRELARRAGTSHATIHAYESGTKEPRFDTVARLADAAGFTLELNLSRRPDAGEARVAKGEELAEVLTLAAAVPRAPPTAADRSGLRTGGRMTLIEKVLAIHRALSAVGTPHAFGGALALAWCTQRARGTVDIDVNLFVEPDRCAAPRSRRSPTRWPGRTTTWRSSSATARPGCGGTPRQWTCSSTRPTSTRRASARARLEPFAGEDVPFLSCRDLAVFKAFFNRTKDWADLEEMAEADTLDVEAVLGVLARYLGADDDRLDRLRSLSGRPR